MQISGVELNELEFSNIGSWPRLIRNLSIFLVFLATLFVGFMFDLSDEWDTLNTLQSKRNDLEKTFDIAQHKVANLDAYKAQVKSVEAALDKLTEQLPQNSEEAGLLEDISEQAASSNLQFVSIKPGQEQTKEFYIESPMQLTLSGEYRGLGEFASSISAMPRIVTLHEFTIEKASKESITGNSPGGGEQSMKGPLVMTVVTKTYWTAIKFSPAKDGGSK